MSNETENLTTTEVTSAAAPSEAAATTTSTGLQGGNGAAVTTSAEVSSPTWLDNLPDDVKNEPSLANLKGKGVADLAKGYVNAQKEIGSRIRIPTSEASAEATAEFRAKVGQVPGVLIMPDPNDPKSVDEFFTKLGRPATAEGYKIETPQFLSQIKDPVVAEAVNQEINQFRQAAFQLGLNNHQVQALTELQVQKTEAQLGTMVQENQQANQVLREVWGNEFDNKIALAKEAVGRFATKFPDAANKVINGPLGNNPIFLQMAADAGRAYKESGLIKGESITVGGNTPDEARAKIADIKANVNHPANPLYKGNASPKVRQQAIEEVQRLYQAANPEQNQ